jgi:thioredoxin 1
MSEVAHVTDEELEKKIESGSPLVVDFWAPWCGPCKMVGPIIEELAGQYNGKVEFAKLNVDEHQRIAGQNGISSIPTLLFFKGGKRIDTLIGAAPKNMLEAKVKSVFDL